MASLSSARDLGGVGAILVFFPGLNVIGWPLILLAIKETSVALGDRTIADGAFIAAITAVTGDIAFAGILFAGYLSPLISFFSSPSTPVLLGAVILLFVTWIFGIVSAVFLKRVYNRIGQRLNIRAFAKTGNFYLLGSTLTIILIGLLFVLVAQIFQVVAFLSIHEQPSPKPMATLPQPTTTSVSGPIPQTAAIGQPPSEFKYCFRCGTKLQSPATFCPNCGTKQS